MFVQGIYEAQQVVSRARQVLLKDYNLFPKQLHSWIGAQFNVRNGDCVLCRHYNLQDQVLQFITSFLKKFVKAQIMNTWSITVPQCNPTNCDITATKLQLYFVFMGYFQSSFKL